MTNDECGACVTVASSDHFTGEVKVKNGRFLVAADAASGAQGYRLLAGHSATVGVTTGTADVVLPEVAVDDQLFNEKYFRFTVKRTYGDTIVQLSEFSLYDKDGVRQNLNLAKSTGVDASTLAPGEFWTSSTYSWGANGGEGPGNLFDANTATKACLGSPAPTDENDSSKYCVITMRLADSANPVATYSFTMANDSTPARNPSYWTLEASRDGVNWKTIDEKTNWRSSPTATFTETELFTHAKTEEAKEGDLVENAVSVAVASGSEARIYGPAEVSLEGGAATPTGLERLETDDFAKWTFTEQAQADYDALGANGFWILYGEANKAGSAFLTERVDVARPWRVTFTYLARAGASTEWADGIAFCIHNEAEGAAFCDTTRLGGALAGAAAGHATCAAIYYSSNGRTPTATARYLYSGPFTISGTATVTAFAVKDGVQSDYVDATITYTIPEVLTLRGVLDEKKLDDVTTDGSAEWSPVEDASAKVGGSCAMSGEVADDDDAGQTTMLRTKVRGRGTLSFWWRVDCEPDPRGRFTYDYGSVAVDSVVLDRKDGTTEWMNFSTAITTDGEHEIVWTYASDGYPAAYGEYAGRMWVDGVSWSGVAFDPLPAVDGDAEVAGALAGSVDARLTRYIKTAEEYNAFRAWLDAKGIDHQAAKDSPRAWFSYALDAEGLIDRTFKKGDVVIDSVAAQNGGAIALSVAVAGVRIGANAKAENLARVFSVEGAAALGVGAFSSESVTATFGATTDGKLSVVATPKSATGTLFLRVCMVAL